MKKSLLVCLFIGGLFFGAFAQQGQDPHPRKSGKMQNPEERAEMKSKHMQESLNLTTDQYKKVLAINLKQEKTREEFRKEQKEKMKANREQMKANHDALIKSYEGVLTPEQMTKLREEQKKRRGEARERMKGPRKDG